MAAFDYNALVQEAKASGATTSFEPLPDGEYSVVVDKAESTTSKKGDPQVKIVYKVTEGPHQNRLLWQYMTFIPGNGTGLAINFRQLDVLGATPLLEQGGSLAQVAGFLLGKTAVVKVAQRTSGDKVYNDIKDVKKGSSTSGPGPVGGFSSGPASAPASSSTPF